MDAAVRQANTDTCVSFNTVQIDVKALRDNYTFLRKKSRAELFLAMVKANAYGHDMAVCAQILEQAGCDAFGVAELPEAIALREAGVRGKILVMLGFAPQNVEEMVTYDITPLIYDSGCLEGLSREAVRQNKEVGIHLKVNTGMCRLGFELPQLQDVLSAIARLPGLSVCGMATHFPEADDPLSSSTRECFARFNSFAAQLGDMPHVIRHVANSGATLYFPETHRDMVRCGISLYGYYPEGRDTQNRNELQPVMSFSTRVLQVREVEAGVPVSYGGTYITSHRSRLAVLPVGYEDGYSRGLSGCGEVLIRGKRAPVRGRICMNLCMVDVTDIEGVQPYDEAVLLGSQGDDRIDADDLAEKLGTISYEILCMIGNNNRRCFVGQ